MASIPPQVKAQPQVDEDYFFNLKANQIKETMSQNDAVLPSDAEIILNQKSSFSHIMNNNLHLRKPKYLNKVHTGYVWNKYNRTHYDHDNPPPKFVQGYKFNIFYPNLLDRTKAPRYFIEKDGDSTDTCIIRFHGGPPYEDLAFRIVHGGEWEYSSKKGFKCSFDGRVLHLYFNFKRISYRR